ncbi:unnamed protein product [Brassica oleracea]
MDEKVTPASSVFIFPTKTMSLVLFLSKSYGVYISDVVTLLLFRHKPPYVHLRRDKGHAVGNSIESCKDESKPRNCSE